jgi:hypothetical protein
MVLELNFSFLVSFHDSFFGYLLSHGFMSYPISEFEPPTSPNSSRLLARSPMRRGILRDMSMTFSYGLKNPSSVVS